MAKTYFYHFNVGNSSTGPIGYGARIEASSKAEAVARLRELLPEVVEDVGPLEELHGYEYIHVYFNYETEPTEEDIVEIEDVDGHLLEDGDSEDETVAERVAGILGVARKDV